MAHQVGNTSSVKSVGGRKGVGSGEVTCRQPWWLLDCLPALEPSFEGYDAIDTRCYWCLLTRGGPTHPESASWEVHAIEIISTAHQGSHESFSTHSALGTQMKIQPGNDISLREPHPSRPRQPPQDKRSNDAGTCGHEPPPLPAPPILTSTQASKLQASPSSQSSVDPHSRGAYATPPSHVAPRSATDKETLAVGVPSSPLCPPPSPSFSSSFPSASPSPAAPWSSRPLPLWPGALPTPTPALGKDSVSAWSHTSTGTVHCMRSCSRSTLPWHKKLGSLILVGMVAATAGVGVGARFGRGRRAG